MLVLQNARLIRIVLAVQLITAFCLLATPVATATGVETWHERASGSMYGVYFEITYGNGRFVAGGNYLLSYSDDCVNWTDATLPHGDNFVDVYFDGTKFWAAGHNDATLLNSTDGENWTFLSTGDAADNEHYKAVVQGDGMVATGGAETTTYKGGLFYSNDGGLNFTPVYPPELHAIEDIIYVDGTFIAGGVFFPDSGGIMGKIYLSDDGITWNEVIPGVGIDINGLAHGDNLFVAVGHMGKIITSSDGLVWTERVSGTTQELTGVAWGNGYFVAVGDGGTILTSTDGISWTEQTSGTSFRLRGVGFGDDTFFAVGSEEVGSGFFLYTIIQSDPVSLFEDGFESGGTSLWSSSVGE